MATSLTEEHRSKLDSIVSQMESNGEKPEDIQFVVNDFKSKYSGMGESQPQDTRSLGVKAWQALQKPSEMSAQGLRMLADYVSKPEPTGNLPLDLLKGAPRIAADTMAEAAPSFINRASILGAAAAPVAGAMAPIVKPVLRGIGSQFEQMSGIAPKAEGALEAAYKDSSLILNKGKKAASEVYEAGKATAAKPYSAEVLAKLKAIPDKLEYVKQARQLAQEGVLGEGEALEARKALDGLKKTVRQDYFTETRKMLDDIVKSNSKLSEADIAYKRGVQAENLRNLVPQNKYGGASPFKMMLLKLTGGLAAPALVPAIQGATATGAGIAARQAIAPLANSPEMSAALASLLSRRKTANAR